MALQITTAEKISLFFLVYHHLDLTVIFTAQIHSRIFAGHWTALPSQKIWCGFEIHTLHQLRQLHLSDVDSYQHLKYLPKDI